MGIWTFKDARAAQVLAPYSDFYRLDWRERGGRLPEHLAATWKAFRDCSYCGERLVDLSPPHPDVPRFVSTLSFPQEDYCWTWRGLRACPCCGWWVARDESDWRSGADRMLGARGAVGALRNLDVTDLRQPLGEIRGFLVAQYEARFRVHPRLWEETVAAVFRNLGYDAVVTSYSADGGIDAILRRGDVEVGVQVKRYRNTIQVEQIHALIGAMVRRGFTKGVFVTTSSYSRGCSAAVRESVDRGYAVELFDAPRFYDALKLSQRPMYTTVEEFAQLHDFKTFPVIDSVTEN